jgi:hypothetical protein
MVSIFTNQVKRCAIVKTLVLVIIEYFVQEHKYYLTIIFRLEFQVAFPYVKPFPLEQIILMLRLP